MTIDIILGDPENIRSVNEAEFFLSRIRYYERKNSCRVGILMIQRRNFPLYLVTTEQEAIREMTNPTSVETPESGIKFYRKDYIEVLRDALQLGQRPDYRELDRQHTLDRQQLRAA